MRALALMCFMPLLSACSVDGNEERVTVKHSAEQQHLGYLAAEKHCAKYDKKPRLLKVSPTTSDASLLYLRTKTSVYACLSGAE